MSGPRLRWVKVCSYVWVDDSAFYAIRLRTRNRSVPAYYEVNTSYPGCMAQEIGAAGSLAEAKAIVQLDHDGLYAEPGREEAA